MTLTVGTSGTSYVSERNLTALPFERCRIVRTYDIFNVLNYVNRRVFHRSNATSFFNCFHFDAGLTRVPLFHFINELSSTPTPWVVTFSHYLPRWNVHSRFGMKLLAGDPCRKIIAISQFAYQHQLHYLEEFPEYKDRIHPKMCVIHPAQHALIDAFARKETDPEFITFTIIGTDFFRKGGIEILTAFDRLVAEQCPVKLVIISSMDYGDYASSATKDDLQKAWALINKLKNHIEYHGHLPNDKVLQLLLRSHIGLLPTYDDIYGYSVLEAQAAGCPVISTDVCALPEINNDDIGWVIPVPKDEFGIAFRHTEAERRSLSEIMIEGLYHTVKGICADPDIIRQKGSRALERIKRDCLPVDRARRLEVIYTEVLDRG